MIKTLLIATPHELNYFCLNNKSIIKLMLHLKLPTDPRWANIAEKNLAEILIDHAYCEQKAASTCISLIVQFPEKDELVDTLTPVVAEEWEHFERVIKEMKKRGIALGKQRKDEYVNQLVKKLKKLDK